MLSDWSDGNSGCGWQLASTWKGRCISSPCFPCSFPPQLFHFSQICVFTNFLVLVLVLSPCRAYFCLLTWLKAPFLSFQDCFLPLNEVMRLNCEQTCPAPELVWGRQGSMYGGELWGNSLTLFYNGQPLCLLISQRLPPHTKPSILCLQSAKSVCTGDCCGPGKVPLFVTPQACWHSSFNSSC